MLALFLASRRHYAWQSKPEETRYRRVLPGRLKALDKDFGVSITAWEKARIQNAAEEVLASIYTVLVTLKREHKQLSQGDQRSH